MKNNPALDRRGQILPGAIAMLVILAVMIPSMVLWIQRENVFASKQSMNTTAFHLAEAGAEKAYLYVSLSTITWNAIQAGTSQADYRFDKSFTDIAGGTYAISVTSGPGAQQVTIVTVGRDRYNKETRALRIVYSNAIFGGNAIYAGQGVQIGGQVDVEWGAVMSPNTIDAASRNFPQFWSASQIISKDTSANPPNCDSPGCIQWHSYQTNLPTPPVLDFDFYRTSAAATMGCFTATGTGSAVNTCYFPGNVTNWNGNTRGTIFIEGDLTVKSPGMYHIGKMIVMGNINLPNGQWGNSGSPGTSLLMPADAWKQYGIAAAWTHYRDVFDQSAPAAFPGMNSTSYTSPTLCSPSPCLSQKVAVNGFLYVGGNFNNGGGGGGNSDIYGVLYAVGTATQTASSQVTFYYNGDATTGLVTTNVSLTRASWKDEVRGWPPGL